VLGALQTSTFMTLGRLFDQNSMHNVDRLLKIAQSNMAIFSKEALARRNKNLRDVYVPNADDFRRLRRHVAKRRKVYKDNYQALRRQIFGHKEICRKEDERALFGRTNIRELQLLLIFLRRLHEALWELYHNGHKPTLRPARYSIKRIREQPSPQYWVRGLQERLVHEIEVFLIAAANETQKSQGRKRSRP